MISFPIQIEQYSLESGIILINVVFIWWCDALHKWIIFEIGLNIQSNEIKKMPLLLLDFKQYLSYLESVTVIVNLYGEHCATLLITISSVNYKYSFGH